MTAWMEQRVNSWNKESNRVVVNFFSPSARWGEEGSLSLFLPLGEVVQCAADCLFTDVQRRPKVYYSSASSFLREKGGIH
jgi:hypothetical protein